MTNAGAPIQQNKNMMTNNQKTVNIYKFSNAFLKDVYLPEIEKYISLYGKQEYYEMALGNVIKSQCGLIKGMVIRSQWYEIDTIEDLEEAKKRF